MKTAFVIAAAFLAGITLPHISGLTWQGAETFFDLGHVVLLKGVEFILLLSASVMILLLEATKLKEIAVRFRRPRRRRRNGRP